jgi:hypothetical protein
MWAFDTRLQAIVVAVGAGDEIALRPGKEIDDQSDEAGKEYKQHPQNRTIHPTRFGIARNPHEQGNVERDENDGNEDKCAAASTAGEARRAVCEGILRRGQHIKKANSEKDNCVHAGFHLASWNSLF